VPGSDEFSACDLPSSYRVVSMRKLLITAAAVLCASATVQAQSRPTGVPAFSSRPTAGYTLYLNFAGFDFTGAWLGKGTPGWTPAYGNATGTFTALQQSNIAAIWARVAEKYAVFNVNVTTVDPAVAALGPTATDAQRQAYYDSTPELMHTVVGGTGSWLATGGSGTSAMSTMRMTYGTSANSGAGYGYHTNWVFAGMSGMYPAAVGEIVAHEQGHGLSLHHHCDCANGVITNAYSTNFGASGTGSYVPVMGSPYHGQRSTWRVGTASRSGITLQNDVQSIMTNSYGIGPYVETGVGHSTAAAGALPLSGSAVNPALAKGIIVPASATAANPLGASNYVADYFSFRSDGGASITLTAVNGGSRLTPGVADPGATLRSTLKIFDAAGNVVATATEAADTLSTRFNGTLPAGRYFAQVASAGGHVSLGDPTAVYYEMGSYFLTGNGFSAARWTGPATGQWTAAANWLGGVAPMKGETAEVPAGVTVAAKSVRQAGLTAAGRVAVSSVAQGGETSRIGTLALTGSGQLDLADTRAVIDAGDANLVRQYLQTAYADGTWTGPGLTSSVAATDPLSAAAIGYVTASQLGTTAWGGIVGLTGSELLTRLTVAGDANLDGRIDSDDFSLLDRGLRSHGGSWMLGDFDYSGVVDAADAWLQQRSYLLQTDPAAATGLLAQWEVQYGQAHVASLLVSVPEPAAALTGLLLGTLATLRRTGRRR
jgi:hypothetical protein